MPPLTTRAGRHAPVRQVTRRGFGLLVGAAATAAASSAFGQTPGAASAQPVIPAHTFNHIAMRVSDVQRAVDWYQRMFGLPAQFREEPPGRRVAVLRIGDGAEFLELAPVAPGEPPAYLHLGFGVQDFDPSAIRRALSAQGLAGEWRSREAAGGDVEELVVRDPDGLRIQVQDARYTGGGGRLGDVWDEPWNLAPRAATPFLAVRNINHATFGSASKERAERFYQDVFGLRLMSWDYRPREPSRILGFVADSPRQFVAPGQGRRIGISHYCLGVEGFNRERVVRTLSELGVSVRPAGEPRPGCCGSGITYSPSDTVFFQDPDGFVVQLTDMDYCAGTGPIGVIPAL